MKVLSTDGLTKLIQLIKSAFISVNDTVSANTVTLADVATSGSYEDLTDKPTIPEPQFDDDTATNLQVISDNVYYDEDEMTFYLSSNSLDLEGANIVGVHEVVPDTAQYFVRGNTCTSTDGTYANSNLKGWPAVQNILYNIDEVKLIVGGNETYYYVNTTSEKDTIPETGPNSRTDTVLFQRVTSEAVKQIKWIASFPSGFSTPISVVSKLETYPIGDFYSNIKLAGSPTLTNHVLSGFNESNYAIMPEVFDPSGSWEMVWKFNTSDVSTSGVIYGPYTNGYYGVLLKIADSKLKVSLGNNGSSFFAEIIGSTTLSNNTDYYAKVEFTIGSGYNLYLSTDGVTYTLEGSSSSTTTIHNPKPQAIGVNNWSGGVVQPFQGSIDLNGCYINVNGARWWSGVEQADNSDEVVMSPSASSLRDGQWVPLAYTIVEKVSLNGSSELVYDLSGAIPTDGYNYEALLVGRVITDTTTSHYSPLYIGSSLTGNHRVLLTSAEVANNTRNTIGGSVVIPIGPDRKLYVIRSTSYYGSIEIIFITAIRRIGANV